MTLRSLLLGAALFSQGAVFAQSDLQQVNQIRRYCDDINASRWTERRVAELDEAWIDAYYRDGELRKISARTFSETASGVTEYYLRNDTLIHVYEQLTDYTASPADSTTLEATLQDMTATLLVPRKVESRSFFVNNRLIRYYTNGPALAPPARADHAVRTLQRLGRLREAVKKR